MSIRVVLCGKRGLRISYPWNFSADEESSLSWELYQANNKGPTTLDISNFGIRISNLRELRTLLLAALSSYGLMWSVASNRMGCLRCRSNPKCTTVTSAGPRCRTSTASSSAPGVVIRETAPIRNPMTVRVHSSRFRVQGWWLVTGGWWFVAGSVNFPAVVGHR